MYCTDKDCSQPGKCQCLKSGLPCIDSCSSNNTEYLCPNIEVDASEDSESEDNWVIHICKATII